MICMGYAEAKNECIYSYEANKLTPYIIYLDANNLYGQSMMQSPPTEILD